jgi:hypothetical protein
MMRLLLSFVLFFWVTFHVVAEEIVIDFTHPKFARLDAEGKKLLSEYARTYPKIRDFYGNIRMDVNMGKANYPSEKELESLRSNLRSEKLNEDEIEDVVERSKQSNTQYEIRSRLADKHLSVDRKVNHPVMPSVRAKLPPELSQYDYIQEAEMSSFTPTVEYQLSKYDPRNPYFSLNTKRNMSKPNAQGISMEVLYFDGAPFSSDGMVLEKSLFQSPPLVAEKSYPVVDYVRQKKEGKEQIVEIRLVSSRYLDSNPDDIHGVIRLHRNSWVVKETFGRTQVISPGKYYGDIDWIRSSCTYNGMVDGVPLLKTYQRSNGHYNKETHEENIERQMLCEVTKLVPGPVNLSEFDVAQFLPPPPKAKGDEYIPAILPPEYLPPEVKVDEITPARQQRIFVIRIVGIVGAVISILMIILGIYLKLQKMKGQ